MTPQRLNCVLVYITVFHSFVSTATEVWPQNRLDDGVTLSAPEYDANVYGALSLGVGTSVGSGDKCNGVLISTTTFVTSVRACPILFDKANFAIGSPYYSPSNPSFDGQRLNITSGPVFDSLNYAAVYTVNPIPGGSKALPALQKGSSSVPPGPSAVCVGLGYSVKGFVGPMVYRLNSRPANITDYSICKSNYPTLPLTSDGTLFCATVLNNNGQDAICSPSDVASILMCQEGGTTTTRGTGRSEKVDQRTLDFCRVNPAQFLCRLLCLTSLTLPFCTPFLVPVTPTAPLPGEWYLAGVEVQTKNPGCGTGSEPTLFYHLPRLRFPKCLNHQHYSHYPFVI